MRPELDGSPAEVFRERVRGALSGEAWVASGNYGAARDIIWLPPWFWGCVGYRDFKRLAAVVRGDPHGTGNRIESSDVSGDRSRADTGAERREICAGQTFAGRVGSEPWKKAN